jgi:hypothetical protein
VLDVGGGPPRRFFGREEGNFSNSACWSPDGEAVAVVIVEGDDDPAAQARTGVVVVGTDGHVLKTIPLPDPSSSRGVIDWR